MIACAKGILPNVDRDRHFLASKGKSIDLYLWSEPEW